MTTQLVNPLRNLSYNDIKKRRLLRESQSKSNVRLHYVPDSSIPRTQKKQMKNIDHSDLTNQKQSDLNFIKQLFVKKNLVSHHNKSVQPATPYMKNIGQTTAPKDQLSDRQFHLGSSRQIVKNLIQDSKSERKLLRYSELRNKFKLSKSRTKSVQSLTQKSTNLTAQQLRKKQANKSTTIPVNKNIKITSHSHRERNYRYLILVPKQKQQKQSKEVKEAISPQNRLEDQVESSISVKKQSDIFDSQDQKILQQLNTRQQNRQLHTFQDQKEANDEKILDLLGLEPNQIQRNLNKQAKRKKGNYDFGKFAKKFPAGFFRL